MKIEAGKTYLARDGRRVRALCTDRNDANHPVIGVTDDGQLIEYTATGFYFSDGAESNLDLVREAPKTVTLYLYKDDSGNIYGIQTHTNDETFLKTIEVEL